VFRADLLAMGALLSALTLVPAPAQAAENAPRLDAATKAKAAAKFKEGERAFQRHEYEAAAAAFEAAYDIAPHPAALFNAATAHQKSGKLTRAANLCARYLRDAPENDPRREKANALLGELTPKLGRVEVQDRGASDVELDARSLEGPVTYVDPGDHVVTARFGDKGVQRKISVVAGSLVRVVLEPPKKETSAALEEEGEGREEGRPSDAVKDAGKGSSKPLSPAIFYVGVGVTAVLAGVTVWSGIDTNKARSDFDARPTQSGLDEGKAKQSRTNLLIGATAAAGVGTAVIGIFFTDWKGKPKPKPVDEVSLGFAPAFVTARGSFW
jgi:hypothetical protein